MTCTAVNFLAKLFHFLRIISGEGLFIFALVYIIHKRYSHDFSNTLWILGIQI